MEQESNEMAQLRQYTEEFVNLLSAISEKYGIEAEDIQSMNDGLEKVWNSVTIGEDELSELPEEIDDEMEAAEELQLEMEEEDEEE